MAKAYLALFMVFTNVCCKIEPRVQKETSLSGFDGTTLPNLMKAPVMILTIY